MRKRRSPDTSAKGPWSRALGVGTPVVWPATMPGVRFAAPLDGLARVRVARPYCRPMDVIIMPGPTPVADDAASVLVRSEPFAHRGAGVEQVPGLAVARLRPPMPRSAAVVVGGWSDSSGVSPLPWWGERPRVGVAMRSSPPVERRWFPPAPGGSCGRLLLGIDRLGKAA